jgi:small-conductance mechanosensitive channel
MFETLIPTAYAQATTVRNAVTGGANAIEESGVAGIQKMFKFIVSNIDNWLFGIGIVVLSYLIAKIISGRSKDAIIKSKGEDVPESVLILVERMTKIVIIGVGITIAFAINGLNFTAVIGALSLGIGFALKDIIGNFISSVILLSQERFRIGDLVKVGDIIGTIVSIDTRVTILQSIDGTEVVIPNQTMLNETVISYSTNPFRRIELVVGVDYGTDLPMVTSLIKGILDKDDDVVDKPESLVLVDEFGSSSINIKVLFWIESGNNWLKTRSNIAYRIKKAFNELGISIPFPIRTLKLDEDDRAVLKTLDSFKKGFIPEEKLVQTNEQIRASAAGTKDAVHIPYPLFDDSPSSASHEQPAETKRIAEPNLATGSEPLAVAVKTETSEMTPTPPSHL